MWLTCRGVKLRILATPRSEILAVMLELLLALRFSSVTQEVGLSNVVGRIAAFADFNANKVTDVLVLNSTGGEDTILLWNSKSHRFIRNDIKLDVPSPVAEVRTGDFNGDGVVDILTLVPVSEVKVRRCYTPILYLCHVTDDGRVAVNGKTAMELGNMSSISLPLVLDINGDHIPDLFATTCTNNGTLHTPTFFVSTINNNGSFTFSPHPLPLHPPPSSVAETITNSYFVDLDSDCLPELVLYRNGEGNRSMEVWKERGEEGLVMISSQSLPSVFSPNSTKVVGLPIFADMDGDGLLEVVLFSCYDSQCNQTAVHVLHLEKFSGADVVGCQGAGDSWKLNFTSVMTVNLTGTSFEASSLHLSQPTISDLDGYPDIVTSVSSRSTSSDGSKSKGAEGTTTTELQRPLVLLGLAGGRLRPQWKLFNEAAVANVTQAAFFDLWEDGVLDVLMVQGGTLRGDKVVPPAAGNLLAYRQSLSEDHTFLKVLVLSGHCFQDCRSGQKPYGSVLPGATVSFSTTGRTGHNERSVANIQYSSSNSLQLPFILFGLGETPNFIEALTVGAGYRDSDVENGNWTFNIGLQFHQWSLLVPNSQVIVIPSPIDNAKSWHIELYLTPSNLVYSTAGVLCALAVGIAIIIGLLQAREKVTGSRKSFFFALKVMDLEREGEGWIFIEKYRGIEREGEVSFSTTGRTGHTERSVANIHYSSSNSLQLPFVLFGLGETPNFIEALTVGAGYRDSDVENGNWTFNIGLQFHQWSLLVPNSQVIVIPSPINNAKSWHIELYLTPSNLVYSTAGVLCALAVGIAIIIGLLQAREKYQDSKEKKQAKHRFHFNAMY